MYRLILAVLLSGPAWAGDVSVSVKAEGQGVYLLEGSFVTAAPTATAWNVLTDYNGIPAFVSSMKSSRVLQYRADSILLQQESVGGLFFLKKTVDVLLEVREEPLRRIEFKDISKTSFESYEGSWELQDAKGGVLVRYRLQAKNGFAVPGFVMRGASRKGVEKLLDEVKTEMERRGPVGSFVAHEDGDGKPGR